KKPGGNQETADQGHSGQEGEPPKVRRLAAENGGGDLVGDGAERLAARNHVGRPSRIGRTFRVALFFLDRGHSPFLRVNAGLGFRNSARYVVRGRVFNSASKA